jgi:hypothetical protein
MFSDYLATFSQLPRQLAEAVIFLTCIQEVCGSNLGQITVYLNGGFSHFFQSVQMTEYLESGQDRFLSHTFQYSIHCHRIISCCIDGISESVVK